MQAQWEVCQSLHAVQTMGSCFSVEFKSDTHFLHLIYTVEKNMMFCVCSRPHSGQITVFGHYLFILSNITPHIRGRGDFALYDVPRIFFFFTLSGLKQAKFIF